MSNFSFTLKSTLDAVVLVPEGYINDVGAERLEHTIQEYLGNGCQQVVVNFSKVQFINTIGISIFTGVIHKTQEHDGLLCFTNLKKNHLDIFEFMGLTKHVKVFKDEEDAVSFLKTIG
jgi:anti-anti-sigma factor